MRGLGMQDGPHGGRLPPPVLEPKSEIGCEPGYQRPPREPPRPPPPPKPPRPPPPPPRRSPPPPAPGAFAFSSWMVRPSRLVPLRRLMACSASSGVAISTKPKPRDRPVSRSVTTLADSTLPAAAKASRRRSLEVENARPPTKSLTAMAGLLLTARKQSEYTLVTVFREPNLPEVRSGRGVCRESPVRRAVPRPLHRGPGSPHPGGGSDRRRGGPVPPGGPPVVARLALLHRGRAVRRHRPLLGRPPLGGAGPRLACRPMGPEPSAGGANQGGIPGPRCEDRVHRPTP